MHRIIRILRAARFSPAPAVAALALSGALAAASAPPAAEPAGFTPRPAERSDFATHATMLDAARAGSRIVAVGDRGVILLSDDEGRSFRQAASVPVAATLTSVSFADERNGWAVGHWGAILATTDGGETWVQQRLDTVEDRPLFAVHFTDARHGVAVGLWSLLLRTEDGGATWEEVALPAPPGDTRADRNLFDLFGDGAGNVYAVGERGTVLKSSDRGRTWAYHLTGYRGSFWTGIALDDGTVLVAGLRGTIYRSGDGGDAWNEIESGERSSITQMARIGDRVMAVGLEGLILVSTDGGRSFEARRRADRLSLTALAPLAEGRAVLFSRAGVLEPAKE